MNNWIKNTLIFAAGALVGGFMTKKYIERKQMMLEEYECKDSYNGIHEDEYEEKMEDPTTVNTEKVRIPSKEEYNRLLDDLRYKAEQEAEEIEHQFDDMVIEANKPNRSPNEPYRISQCEFEELEDYDSDEYTYYADGYITDSYGMPMSKEDIENSFGPCIDELFWDQSVDQTWIRNDRLKMDYSIIRDIDKFEDVAPTRIKRLAGLM